VAFDLQRPVSIEGVVTEVKWENPHSWIFVELKKPDGATEIWRFESQPPNTLRRTGVTAAMLKPGDTVTVKGYGALDTLVVDVTGFNGKIWLADAADKPTPTSTGGWFTSDALHVVERWRRRIEEAMCLDTTTYSLTEKGRQERSKP
jgi:hypothetical protein